MPVGVHVYGPGFGESILLSFPAPDGANATCWGVIDCHAQNMLDAARNPVLNFLDSQQTRVRELEFLCLTHPHADHYEGMSHLFEKLSVKRFWRFGTADVKSILNCLKLWADRTGKRKDRASAREYAKILRHERPLKNGASGVYKRLFDYQRVYPTPLDQPAPLGSLQIFALAPASGSGDEYEEVLRRWLERGPDRLPDRLDPHHNTISVVLMAKYGETRLLFGGDAVSEAWGLILASQERQESLNSGFVKIPHHGSRYSWHSEAWDELSGPGGCYAVITPYDRGENPPPHDDLVQNLRPFCRKIVLTSPKAKIDQDPRVIAYVPLQQTSATSEGVSSWYSFWFDDKGELIDERPSRDHVVLHSA